MSTARNPKKLQMYTIYNNLEEIFLCKYAKEKLFSYSVMIVRGETLPLVIFQKQI